MILVGQASYAQGAQKKRIFFPKSEIFSSCKETTEMPLLMPTEKRNLSQPLFCCYKSNFVTSIRLWPLQESGMQLKLLLYSAASLCEEQWNTWSSWLFIFRQWQQVSSLLTLIKDRFISRNHWHSPKKAVALNLAQHSFQKQQLN